LERMRGAFTAAPTMVEPVMKMPLQATINRGQAERGARGKGGGGMRYEVHVRQHVP
jgi:hypothetical protein